MTQNIYNPNPGFSNPHIKDFDEYLNLYRESIDNPKKFFGDLARENISWIEDCLLYTSPSPRDATLSRMPSSA